MHLAQRAIASVCIAHHVGVTLPGWFGIGSAVDAWAGADDARHQLLATMYREWPFFGTMVDNSQVSMRKADMLIAEVCASLATADDRDPGLHAAPRRVRQHRGGHLPADRADRSAGRGAVAAALDPHAQPLHRPKNCIQVALLRRLRAGDVPDETEALREAVLLSVNGIAAGLRNTG